jgi:hypothetical protein
VICLPPLDHRHKRKRRKGKIREKRGLCKGEADAERDGLVKRGGEKSCRILCGFVGGIGSEWSERVEKVDD